MQRIKTIFASFILVFSISSQAVFANGISCHKTNDPKLFAIPVKCPLGGAVFSSYYFVPSVKSEGRYLDFQPISSVRYPEPLAVCPNGFVAFKDKFEDAELRRIEKIMAEPEYKAMLKTETTYYLHAYIEERLGLPNAELWNIYLKASWQASDCAKGRYKAYAQKTITVLQTAMNEGAYDATDRLSLKLLIADLERRSGQFDKAQNAINDFKNELQGISLDTKDVFVKISDRITALIAQKNTKQEKIQDLGF